MASLDERFDAHLAQAENLQALFVALNDQVFEIRELAICTVGRLSSMNPAFVMPFLRKMLIQVLRCQAVRTGREERQKHLTTSRCHQESMFPSSGLQFEREPAIHDGRCFLGPDSPGQLVCLCGKFPVTQCLDSHCICGRGLRAPALPNLLLSYSSCYQ